MSQEFVSTKPAEEVLSEAISAEKKADLIERLTVLKSTLDQIESRAVEQSRKDANPLNQKDLDAKMKMLQMIGYETRENVAALVGIQLTEKYHPALQAMLKNLEKINYAHSLILDDLLK